VTVASENISKVRIHVERAIQRIKTFHLLDGEEILPMKDIAEQIFTIFLMVLINEKHLECHIAFAVLKK
jgi:hypothetical protein